MLSEEAANTHFIGKLGWHPTRSHLNKDKHINHYITEAENSTMVNLGLIDWLIFLCLTPLSALFQLYHGDQF
jgi:hypothetical protein